MAQLVRTDSTNTDFQKMVAALDAYLAVYDGEDHAYYAQYNKTDTIKHVIVAYHDGIATGCGAFREYEKETVEIKRMFVPEENRGMGLASAILAELEQWALETGFIKCILETVKGSDAVFLYTKNGYSTIPNYGQYVGMEKSACMEKRLK